MNKQDILDLAIASELVRVIPSNIPNNEKYWIDAHVVDPDLYRFARLVEELAIIEAVERIKNISYVSSGKD